MKEIYWRLLTDSVKNSIMNELELSNSFENFFET